MTALSRQKILAKMEKLHEYLGYLRALRKETRSQKVFLSDFHLFGNTERYLQLSIQAIVDITHLLILELGLKRPEDNYEAISLLRSQKIISSVLAHILTKMIGLRNILVHEYEQVDERKIYRVLKERLEDFEQFNQEIKKHLKR